MAGTAQRESSSRKSSAQPVVVEFSGVSTKLGGRQVLDNLSFEVRKGETFVIIGYSGTGKSVTLRHLVGLMAPDAGSIKVDGDEITTMSGRELEEMRKKFGVLFQSGALIAWLSVFENVELPLIEHRRLSRKTRHEIVEQKLKMVNLWPDRDKFPAQISGGMKKRAGLARAIALDPEIVLYDEPSSGLDPVIANEIDKLINNLRDTLGMTSIVVTHDMDSAYFIANRIAMFYHGKMVQVGRPDEIKHSHLPEVQHFITGGKEGHISVRSQAALETGRPPGIPHPSMRAATEEEEQKEEEKKPAGGDTTIMQGFVLLDEIPPARDSDPNATTALGIPRDRTIAGHEPVDDGEKTHLGVASDITVRGEEVVKETRPIVAKAPEAPSAPLSDSERAVEAQDDLHAPLKRDTERIVTTPPEDADLPVAKDTASVEAPKPPPPSASARADIVIVSDKDMTDSGRFVMDEEEVQEDDLVDLAAAETTQSGRMVVAEEIEEGDDSSIAIPAGKTEVEPQMLELDPEPQSENGDIANSFPPFRLVLC